MNVVLVVSGLARLRLLNDTDDLSKLKMFSQQSGTFDTWRNIAQIFLQWAPNACATV